MGQRDPLTEMNKHMTEPEIWKDIPGYDGYQASSLGRIRSVDRYVDVFRHGKTHKRFSRGKELSPSMDRHGYLRYNISGKNVFIHRLVCVAFHGEPKSDLEHAAHLDGCRTNNRPNNLEWKTPAENAQDTIKHGRLRYGEQHHNSKLTPNDVREIREIHASGTASKCQIGRYFGVSQWTVSAIISGKTWRHVAHEETL